MIIVTGASGQLGRLVIARLLKTVPAAQIVAAVRDVAKVADLAAQGVQVRRADYADPASLDAAFQGATKVLLISSSELGQRGPQHRNVVDAAVRAKAGLLAYTSVLHADTSPLALAAEHRDTEAAVRASGLPYSLLRNGWYVENYTGGLGAALAHGALAGGAGEGRIAAAARADYADAAAAVLTGAGPVQQVYELAGDQAFTLAELAAELSRQSGRQIPFHNLPQQDYREMLVSVGLPAPLADLIADSDAQAAKGALYDGSGTLGKLIGRPTISLADAVKAAL
ncbi:SDR family oxidoreductase [Duganella sp. BJB488]|uniref:SDR family oxidoreductase n=1 Tax=unclassified Duganella TaxID=2636909 RepID=UPI000E3436BC|nr:MULTISPECIES: SDR family oxidoreductase [unclassified Duganella]RFP15392.1 SDR family oxidoreductase [Duganella sp. BJB489]RFP19949.1 SDR family oxidoreductase [Duganella sp. BJB488]RFP38337.1 SDR family oxidoreductase [Duganella sp. BJB480]